MQSEDMDSDKNSTYLNSIMFDKIKDEFDKQKQARKTRSKNECDDEYANDGMLRVLFGTFGFELVDMMVNSYNGLKKENAALRQEMKEMETRFNTKVNGILDQVDNIGQYTRRDNVKILGVPVTADENLSNITIDIAKHNGVDLEKNNFSTLHRLNTRDDKVDENVSNSRGEPKKIPSFIVRMVHRDVKHELFSSRKQIKEKNGAPYPNAMIVEDVTPLRSRIMYQLRNRLDRDGNKVYRFVWSREGRIFCRTEAESQQRNSSGQIQQPKPHIVNKVDDLIGLGWSVEEVDDIRFNRRK